MEVEGPNGSFNVASKGSTRSQPRNTGLNYLNDQSFSPKIRKMSKLVNHKCSFYTSSMYVIMEERSLMMFIIKRFTKKGKTTMLDDFEVGDNEMKFFCPNLTFLAEVHK